MDNFVNNISGCINLFDLGPEMIFIVDIHGKVINVNTFAAESFGFSTGDLIGKSVETVFRPVFLSDYPANIEKILSGEILTGEVKSLGKDGKEIILELRERKIDLVEKETGVLCVANDITKRKIIEEALRRSEEKYRLLIENQTDLVVKVDTEGKFLFVSPSYCKTFGKSEEELLGKKFMPLVHEDDKAKTEKAMLDLFRPPHNIYLEQRAMTKDGWRWFSWVDNAILDDNGNVKEIIGVGRDITEKKEAEEALRLSVKSYRGLFNSTLDAIYVLDRQYKFIDVNEGAVKMYEMSASELIGKTPADVSAPGKNNLEKTARDIEKAFEGIPQRFEFWGKAKSGRIFPKDVRLFKGTYFGKEVVFAFARDITEMKKSEEEIRKLSRAIEQSPTLFVITGLDGKIEYVNPKFSEVTGYSKEEVIGQNPRILKSGKTPVKVYEELWNTITSGDEWHGELLNKKKNGEEYWESVYIFPLKNDQGEITHFIGIKEDITQQKKMQQELLEAKEKAEESDRLKSAFLANMSHEIRTPMNAILGFSQLLNDDNIPDDDKKQFIKLIQSSGDSLLCLINDIIDISRIEAEEFVIHKKNYYLNDILNDIYRIYVSMVKNNPEKNVDIILNNIFFEDNIILQTDAERLKQVLRNLLTNAIKFTHSGEIELGCKKHNQSSILLYVRDTGIGIPRKSWQTIFDPFRQVDESETKPFGGAGLGLAISKKIVEMLGGKIWVDSVPGKGSTFYFTHPYTFTS